MVEVEVGFCGICGSDLAEFRIGPVVIPKEPHPLTGHVAPVTLGHEFAGVVTAVGADVHTVEPGQRVSADACWRCNHCAACVSGHYNLCPQSGAIGIASDGAMATRVRVPAYCIVPLADSVSLRSAALLEPYAVGLHALDRGGAAAGQAVVVSGFGPIGVATAEIAAVLGLRTFVVEPQVGRRQRALDLGHEVIDGESARERAREVRRLTAGGADLAVDASGVPDAITGALMCLRRGGSVVVAGIAVKPLEVDAARLVLMEHSLRGSLGYHNDLPRVAAMIAVGRLDTERAVTKQVPLADVPAEMARLSTSAGDDLKVLIEIGGER